MARPILSRRHYLVVALGALAGCSGSGSDGTTPTTEAGNPAVGDVDQRGSLSLASPAFDDGDRIPEEYGYDHRNVNPPLRISGIPSETSSLTLIMDDPDAVEPAGKVWLHWLVWNIPQDTTALPEGWEPTTAIEGTNDFDETGYGGPAPPDREHTYRFKLYALETELDLDSSADKAAVGSAMAGHILAQTQLEGTFAP